MRRVSRMQETSYTQMSIIKALEGNGKMEFQ